jgi:hypothetical protein
MAPVATRETRATTVRLPVPVYEQAKCFVDSERKHTVKHHHVTVYGSLNDFFVTAIQSYLKLLHRRQIDAAFALMAEDADYQKEARLLAEEFEASDWEALRLGEEHLTEEELELATSGSAR